MMRWCTLPFSYYDPHTCTAIVHLFNKHFYRKETLESWTPSNIIKLKITYILRKVGLERNFCFVFNWTWVTLLILFSLTGANMEHLSFYLIFHKTKWTHSQKKSPSPIFSSLAWEATRPLWISTRSLNWIKIKRWLYPFISFQIPSQCCSSAAREELSSLIPTCCCPTLLFMLTLSTGNRFGRREWLHSAKHQRASGRTRQPSFTSSSQNNISNQLRK